MRPKGAPLEPRGAKRWPKKSGEGAPQPHLLGEHVGIGNFLLDLDRLGLCVLYEDVDLRLGLVELAETHLQRRERGLKKLRCLHRWPGEVMAKAWESRGRLGTERAGRGRSEPGTGGADESLHRPCGQAGRCGKASNQSRLASRRSIASFCWARFLARMDL